MARRKAAGWKCITPVGEEEPITARSFGPYVDRIVLAEPALRQLLDLDHGRIPAPGGEVFHGAPRSVRRAVVHQNRLQVRVVLAEHRTQRPLQLPFLVASGYYDRELWKFEGRAG